MEMEVGVEPREEEEKEGRQWWMWVVWIFVMQSSRCLLVFECESEPPLAGAVRSPAVALLPPVCKEDRPAPPSHGGKPSWLPTGERECSTCWFFPFS